MRSYEQFGIYLGLVRCRDLNVDQDQAGALPVVRPGNNTVNKNRITMARTIPKILYKAAKKALDAVEQSGLPADVVVENLYENLYLTDKLSEKGWKLIAWELATQLYNIYNAIDECDSEKSENITYKAEKLKDLMCDRCGKLARFDAKGGCCDQCGDNLCSDCAKWHTDADGWSWCEKCFNESAEKHGVLYSKP